MYRVDFIVFFILFSLVGLVSPGLSETYYVDQHHPEADDGNDGSEETPWETIQHAASTLIYGDTVLVKSGIYYEWVEVKNSGRSGRPIIFKAYPGQTPIIDGTDLNVPNSRPHTKALFYIHNKDFIIIDGFEIRTSDEILVRISGSASDFAKGNVIRNCIVHHNEAGGHNGIHLIWTNDCIIEKNEVYRTGWNAISIVASDDTKIRKNYVHDNIPHAGINIFPRTWENPQGLYVGNDIIGNIVARMGNRGAAVYTRFQTDNVIANNLIYGNRGSGLVMDHNHTGPSYIHEARTAVLNNTISDNGGFGFRSKNATYITLFNNIIAHNGKRDVDFAKGVTQGHKFDNNLYYSKIRFGWGGKSLGTLASWQRVTGQDRHAIETDPGFADRGAEDYRLAADSAAIDAGRNLDRYGVVEDLDGVERPQYSEYDIGAYEFGEETLPPPEGLRIIEK